MSRSQLVVVLVVLSVAAVGCGAAQDPGPPPLRHHLDEQHLAKATMEEKAAMLQAQSDYNRAKQEKMKAEADRDDTKTQLDIARNDLEKAKLEQSSAGKRKDAADKSKDWNQKNLGKRDERVAELTVRAADQRVDALEAKRDWLAKQVRYTEENLYAAEAKYELAKARLAREKNISPSGFAFQAYVDQQEDRSRRAQRAKVIADREREGWQSEHKEWLAKKKEADEARGIDTAASGQGAGK